MRGEENFEDIYTSPLKESDQRNLKTTSDEKKDLRRSYHSNSLTWQWKSKLVWEENSSKFTTKISSKVTSSKISGIHIFLWTYPLKHFKQIGVFLRSWGGESHLDSVSNEFNEFQ